MMSAVLAMRSYSLNGMPRCVSSTLESSSRPRRRDMRCPCANLVRSCRTRSPGRSAARAARARSCAAVRSPWAARPGSRHGGSATLMRRSRNSYIPGRRGASLRAVGTPSRSLSSRSTSSLFVTIGRWPEISCRSRREVGTLAFSRPSPTPDVDERPSQPAAPGTGGEPRSFMTAWTTSWWYISLSRGFRVAGAPWGGLGDGSRRRGRPLLGWAFCAGLGAAGAFCCVVRFFRHSSQPLSIDSPQRLQTAACARRRAS